MKHRSSNVLLLLTSLLLLEQFQLSQCWSIGSRARGKSESPTLDLSRRSAVIRALTFTCSALLLLPLPSYADAKCSDIESCREIGERKEAQALAARPIVRLGDSLQYRVLTQGLGEEQVTTNSKVQIIFSISQANGDYMYSRGFGFNKIDIGSGRMVSDFGTDTLMVDMADDNAKVIPMGIRKAMVGMKRGERRRIECPPELGFATSDWNPKPTNFRGKQQIKDYRALLEGRGSLPPFPAPTIWDVEVVGIRS